MRGRSRGLGLPGGKSDPVVNIYDHRCKLKFHFNSLARPTMNAVQKARENETAVVQVNKKVINFLSTMSINLLDNLSSSF